jgi:quercetin dioxygenase-like cupin family protein
MRARFLLKALTFATAMAAGYGLIAEEPPTGRIAILPDAIKWIPGPPSLPPGAKSGVLEGDPTKPGLFTMRIQLPPNYVIAPHRHPEAERVTVLSGSVYVGFGNKVDKEKSTYFQTGSFYVNPAGSSHFVWTKEGVIVQITGVGPWQLTYADPSDDPRRAKDGG